MTDIEILRAIVVAHSLTPDEQDKFCPNCGARNSQSASYCAGCGKALG